MNGDDPQSGNDPGRGDDPQSGDDPGRTGELRDWAWLVLSIAIPVPWLVMHGSEVHPSPELVAALSGVAILGSAFLLSWATELAEKDIPQSLALLVLALVSVLPEYAVDLSFAIRAAQDPEWAQYAVANMTGANRLLIGIGWASVVLLACRRGRMTALEMPPTRNLELRFLLMATLYSFLVPLDGRLSLFDAAVFVGLFLAYVISAARGYSEEVELVGPPARIEARFGDPGRRLWGFVLFGFAGFAIWISAEPFAESLVEVGRRTAIDEFMLVQWVAPFASESPEFMIALLFAYRMRGEVGLGALISSKVNQWTLLVGALPIAYCIAAGVTSGLPLTSRQAGELWLTSAQSLFAVLVVADRVFRIWEAVAIAGIFIVQLVFPSPEVRTAFTWLYLVLFAGLLVHSSERRQAFFRLLVLRA
ncbi:MAG: sodium:calcium antiporter [bacterium]|nr:sodium:calcium antiporter [bacterium]MCP5070404.1 sodium:calcium antiporter [bacterium]